MESNEIENERKMQSESIKRDDPDEKEQKVENSDFDSIDGNHTIAMHQLCHRISLFLHKFFSVEFDNAIFSTSIDSSSNYEL